MGMEKQEAEQSLLEIRDLLGSEMSKQINGVYSVPFVCVYIYTNTYTIYKSL